MADGCRICDNPIEWVKFWNETWIIVVTYVLSQQENGRAFVALWWAFNTLGLLIEWRRLQRSHIHGEDE